MRRQRGITLVGWLVLLTPFALCFYTGLRLTPVYLNYLKVARTLDALPGQFGTDGASVSGIQRAISRHFEIDSVNYPTAQDIAIERVGSGWRVQARYYDYAPLFGDITLRVTFDKSVLVRGGG